MHKIPHQQNKRTANTIHDINSTYRSFFYSMLDTEALTFVLMAVYKRALKQLSVIAITSKGIEAYLLPTNFSSKLPGS